MKENMFDMVVDRMLARRESIRARLISQYKRVKPFRKEIVPIQEVFSAYNQIKPADMQQLIAKHGQDKVNQFIAEMEQYRDKEAINAITKTFKSTTA